MGGLDFDGVYLVSVFSEQVYFVAFAVSVEGEVVGLACVEPLLEGVGDYEVFEEVAA